MKDIKHYAEFALSRRGLLRGAAVAAGAMMLPSSAAAKDDESKSGYIDAHVHVWTLDTKKYPLAKGYKKSNMKPASFTPEELFSHCKPHGVTRIVLIQMSFYRYDNSYMLDMIRKHQGVFSGVAVIDDGDKPAATMRRLAEQGVRGFRIVQRKFSGDEWLGSKAMAEMWKCGADEGLAMCHLCQPSAFPAIGRMCAKFPKTPVVIDHYGRAGIDGTIRRRDVDNLCALAKHKNVSVKVSAYYALGKKKAPYLDLAPMTRRLLDTFGPERLMWASDCPFQVVKGHEYGPSIDLVRKGFDFLSDDDREWLLRKTAERVLFS